MPRSTVPSRRTTTTGSVRPGLVGALPGMARISSRVGLGFAESISAAIPAANGVDDDMLRHPGTIGDRARLWRASACIGNEIGETQTRSPGRGQPVAELDDPFGICMRRGSNTVTWSATKAFCDRTCKFELGEGRTRRPPRGTRCTACSTCRGTQRPRPGRHRSHGARPGRPHRWTSEMCGRSLYGQRRCIVRDTFGAALA